MLGLANQYHSPEQSAVVGKLQLLFNDKIDVSDAASAIHDLLSPRSTVCIPSYDCKPPSPDPLEANTAFLWDCLGKAAMMVPVNHEGMGRMVCLVHALARMPLVKVKYALHGGDEVREVMASLCNLDEDDPCSLGKVLFCLHEWLFVPNAQYEQVIKAKIPEAPTLKLAYNNFMAFAARLYSAGYSETLRLCPLLHVAEFVSHDHWGGELLRYPRPFVSAAAAWILFAGAELYAMCQSGSPFVDEHLTSRFGMWRWDLWKSRFSHLRRYTRTPEKVRSHAGLAEDMDYIEQKCARSEQLRRVRGGTVIPDAKHQQKQEHKQDNIPKQHDTPKQDQQEQDMDAIIVSTPCLRAEAEEQEDDGWLLV